MPEEFGTERDDTALTASPSAAGSSAGQGTQSGVWQENGG